MPKAIIFYNTGRIGTSKIQKRNDYCINIIICWFLVGMKKEDIF